MSAAAAASKSKASEEFWAQVQRDNAQISASRQAERDAFNAKAEQDRQWAAKGWQPLAEGIYRADPEERYTCGYLPCQRFLVAVVEACPGGVYIEAAVYAGDVAVGRANDLTPALPAGGQALIDLVDTSKMGDKMEVTSARCIRS